MLENEPQYHRKRSELARGINDENAKFDSSQRSLKKIIDQKTKDDDKMLMAQ